MSSLLLLKQLPLSAAQRVCSSCLAAAGLTASCLEAAAVVRLRGHTHLHVCALQCVCVCGGERNWCCAACFVCSALLCRRFLSAVYGKDWHTPDRSKKRNHGGWIKTPDAYSMVQALVEKLSVGAWGGMPYKERQQRCKRRLKQERGL
jgi:hypothetical protein